MIEDLTSEDMKKIESLKKQYPSVFSGKIGKLKDYDVVKLHIDKSVKPVHQRRRQAAM